MMRCRLLFGFLAGVGLALVGIGCPPAPPTSSTGSGLSPSTESVPDVPPPPPDRPDALQARILAAIENVKRRELDTTYGFWTVFHGILGLGPELELTDRTPGRRVKALDYIRGGGKLRGLRFLPSRDGVDVHTATDEDRFLAQGHQDQFIAEMAQWGVPADLPFKVGGREYTYMDFVRHTKMRARVTQKQELGWAVLVIGQYLGTDIAWTNSEGESLRFEDLVRYELDAPMDDEQCLKQGLPPVACGGTHRLFGLSWVYHLHLRRGGQTTGVWKDVAERTDFYKKRARQLQNPDGSFSTNFFAGPGNLPNKDRRMNTTGHILEWLALAMSDEELRQPWVQEAVNALALMFLDSRMEGVDSGALYHAVHGLLIYHARVFGTEKLGPHTPLVPLPPGWKEVKRP